MRILRIAIATAAIAVGGIAVSTPASAANTDTVVIDCAGKGVVKPSEIVLACADAGVMVTNLTWTSWTLNDAKGTGTLVWNTCLPQTCVNGIVQKYRVRVTLGGLASGPSITVFSQMTLAFPKGGPAGADSSAFTLDNPQR